MGNFPHRILYILFIIYLKYPEIKKVGLMHHSCARRHKTLGNPTKWCESESEWKSSCVDQSYIIRQRAVTALSSRWMTTLANRSLVAWSSDSEGLESGQFKSWELNFILLMPKNKVYNVNSLHVVCISYMDREHQENKQKTRRQRRSVRMFI